MNSYYINDVIRIYSQNEIRATLSYIDFGSGRCSYRFWFRALQLAIPTVVSFDLALYYTVYIRAD